MCRTCRYIDPGPSFVFIGPPPSATWPVAAGRRLARSPLPAIRDLDRAPPPPPPSARPAPPSARSDPLPAPGRPPSDRPGPASRCGGGGGARTPPSWHQLGEKRKCWLWGLKIDPQKSTRLQFLHQKVRRLFLGRYWKNHGDRTNTSKDIHKKTWGEGRISPPPLSSASVKRSELAYFDVCWREKHDGVKSFALWLLDYKLFRITCPDYIGVLLSFVTVKMFCILQLMRSCHNVTVNK